MFAPKTLSAILSGFDKTVKNLENLISRNDAKVGDNLNTIETLQADNAKLEAETTQAENVKTNIQKLLGTAS